jgi:hypothetical protein
VGEWSGLHPGCFTPGKQLKIIIELEAEWTRVSASAFWGMRKAPDEAFARKFPFARFAQCTLAILLYGISCLVFRMSMMQLLFVVGITYSYINKLSEFKCKLCLFNALLSQSPKWLAAKFYPHIRFHLINAKYSACYQVIRFRSIACSIRV